MLVLEIDLYRIPDKTALILTDYRTGTFTSKVLEAETLMGIAEAASYYLDILPIANVIVDGGIGSTAMVDVLRQRYPKVNIQPKHKAAWSYAINKISEEKANDIEGQPVYNPERSRSGSIGKVTRIHVSKRTITPQIGD